MILVEQNLDFIAALSQRILIIQKGAITREVAAGRSRRRKSCRRIYRNHHVSPISAGRSQGDEAMAVRRPTLDQLRSVAEDLGMHMGDEELKSYDALMQGNYAAYDAGRCHAGLRPGRELSANARLPSRGRGEQVQRLVRQDHDQGRVERQARRQDDRAEGQCQPGRRADDERRLDARRLRARSPTPPSSRASSTPAAPSSARRIASISASPAAATPARPVPSTIRTRWAIRPAARHRAAASWWRPVKPTWRSAATRADRSASPPRFAASTA